MIQELLSGGSATNSTRLLGERTISNSLFTSNTCPSSSPLLNNSNNITSIATSTLSYTTTAVANSANSAGGASENNSNNNNNNSNSNNLETNNNNNSNSNSNSNSSQNLRCPRCDSTNTKFCYYNNYNLTQPRHFCKTCRRYWTKGGTLRNVPIGGGCRKNKSTISTNSSPSSMSSKSSNHHPNNNFLAKCSKTAFASDMLVNDHNSLFLGNGLLDNPFHTPGPNPLLWSSSPPQSQNTSHILALLRGSNNPFSNPNPNPNSGSSVFTTLGLDSYSSNGAPSSLLGSFTRTTNQQTHLINGFGPDFVENNHGSSNIMDLYQRLKSSSSPTNNYGYNCSNTENSGSTILGHMVGSSTTNSSSSSSTMMNSNAFETTSLGGGGGGDHLGGYGFMMSASPAFSSWSEFPAVPINGAYP